MVRPLIAASLFFSVLIGTRDVSAQTNCAPSIYVACEDEVQSRPVWQWRTEPTLASHVLAPNSANLAPLPVPRRMSTSTKLVLGATAAFGLIGFAYAVGGHDNPDDSSEGWRDEFNGVEGFVFGAVLPWFVVAIVAIAES